MGRHRAAGLMSLGLSLALVLAGCTKTAQNASASTTTTTTLPAPAPVTWTACQHGLECGTVTVPLDYAWPDGPTIDIALARHPAEDPAARIGSLLINPGGPGGSGIDDLPAELSVLTSGVLQRFDIVSFDPRGVERSAPVSCGETAGASAGLLPDPAPQTATTRQATLSNDSAYAEQCAKATGLALGFMGSLNAARDMDRIRAALGDAALTYIGHSYGTLLGLLYAQLFPTHVRAMVLDGVIDPAITTVQMVSDQAVGFEAQLDHFLSWCASSPDSCSWRPGAQPLSALLALADRLRANPLPAGGGNQAGAGELYTAVLSELYSPAGWGRLGGALAAAEGGNGAALLALTTSYNTENGPNSVDAGNAINCLDHPVDRNAADYPQLADAAAAQAPFMGPLLVWGLLQCAVWPVRPDRSPAPVVAAGAPPILLVSSSEDPATPHVWAEAVARELARSALVTWTGEQHVAYYYSQCVRNIAQAYLVDGALPASGTQCTD